MLALFHGDVVTLDAVVQKQPQLRVPRVTS